MQFDHIKYCLKILLFVFMLVMIGQAQTYLDIKRETPFSKKLSPLIVPEDPDSLSPVKISSVENSKNSVEINNQYGKTYIFRPHNSFKLVVTREEYPFILPDKDVNGVISLRITQDYMATSRVIYVRKPYRFDRLGWAIKTGWNETIPFFSRQMAFKPYLKSFDGPVYAHFYIVGVREYPECPGQFYHWPRETLEDYYFYILKKIETVASQN